MNERVSAYKYFRNSSRDNPDCRMIDSSVRRFKSRPWNGTVIRNVALRGAAGPSPRNWHSEFLFNRIERQLLIRGNRQAILLQAVQVSTDCIARHFSGVFQSLSFRHQAGGGLDM